MWTRKSFLAAVCAATLGVLLIAASAPAWSTDTNYVTFSAPVALPGVTLAPGTYIFRVLNETDNDVVQVLDRARSRSYFMGLTHLIERPNGQGNRMVALGEAAAGQATPIRAWFPLGKREGHSFIYER